MATPTAPYCTTAQVAALNPASLNGKLDFDEISSPNRNQVSATVDLISAHVESQFAQAGYKVPFEVMDGEEWPPHATTYLSMVAAIGVAARVFGHMIAPAPHLSRSGGRLGNLFDEQYNVELRKIFNYITDKSQIRLRAAYWPNTPAEATMKLPWGPMLDYQEGKYDPERHLSFWDMTLQVASIQNHFKDLNMSWDYFYESGDSTIGEVTEEQLAWTNWDL